MNANEYGKYIGTVKTEWQNDGRQMKLLDDFSFVDSIGVAWNAPAGALVDGASIPTFAWAIIGSPFTGKYRDGSIVHDVACQEKLRRWENVHLMFYRAIRTSGVSEMKSKIMYGAVYHFGPRWSIQKNIQLTKESATSENNRICINFPGYEHNPVCFEVNDDLEGIPPFDAENSDLVFSVNVKPPEKALTHANFVQLIEKIEHAENTSAPMTLEQIANYQ